MSITNEKLTVSFDRGPLHTVRIGYRDEIHEMEQGETLEIELERDAG